jgi:tRNA nucleotidyltransferase (CCA-adding enzyme)
LMDNCDALRRPDRFADILQACACDHHGRLGYADTPYPQQDYLMRALACLQSHDYAAIARAHAQNVADAIALSKFHALQTFIDEEEKT